MNMHETVMAESDADLREESGGMSTRVKLAIGLAVLLLALIAAWFVVGGGDEAAPAGAADEASGEASGPRVTVMVPEVQSVTADVRVTGSIAATRDLPVGVQGSGGKVMRVFVKEGDYVRRGQVLAEIDRSVQVQQVAQLRASVQQARADLNLAQSELERAEALVDRGFISTSDIERRIATRDGAAARVNVSIAQLRAAEATLAQLSVTAPEAGLVLTRSVEPGQVVSAGSGALFRVAQGGQMELRAEVAEQDLTEIEVGQGAAIRIVGNDNVYRGTVSLVDPIIDPQSRQGTARIAVSGDDAVRPGAFATATIETGTASRPVLPESAVLGDVSDSYVYVVDAEGRVARQSVVVGSVTSTGVVIVSGLDGDERIVESAGAFLNEGDKVQPVTAGNAG